MKKLSITTTKNKEVVDITDKINKLLVENQAKDGLCHLFVPHSTVGLTTAFVSPENELDLIDSFDIVMPHILSPTRKHEHSHIASHLPDHVVSSFLGSSLVIPVVDGKLALGEFQRAVLVELNGPRKRTVVLYYD